MHNDGRNRNTLNFPFWNIMLRWGKLSTWLEDGNLDIPERSPSESRSEAGQVRGLAIASLVSMMRITLWFYRINWILVSVCINVHRKGFNERNKLTSRLTSRPLMIWGRRDSEWLGFCLHRGESAPLILRNENLTDVDIVIDGSLLAEPYSPTVTLPRRIWHSTIRNLYL